MKLKVSEKIRAFLDRAEKLKLAIDYNQQKQTSNPQMQSLICSFCTRSILVTEDYKVGGDKNYHSNCFEETIGLIREENKTFLTSKDTLRFKVEIPKKRFQSKESGEEFIIQVSIDNPTSKKVNAIVAYLLLTETSMRMEGMERKAFRTSRKHGRVKWTGPAQPLPIAHGSVQLKLNYAVPKGLLSSERAGPTAVFVREWELVVKASLPSPHRAVKLSFPVFIS